MPKEHRIFIDVPRLYKRQALDHIMFGYVTGIRRVLPSESIKKCIIRFLEDNEMSEDDYSLDSALKSFFRMQEECYATKKET